LDRATDLEFEVNRRVLALVTLLGFVAAVPAPAATPAPAPAHNWVEGENYYLVDTIPRSAPPPGKIVVTEVFSYGCPACNEFNPTAKRLIASLPSNVVFTYVPAGFIPAEDWPTFQRAFCTAESLGIAAKAHDAMFEAVWKTGELAIMNPTTHQLRSPLPTIADIAAFYAKRTGVKAADFVAAANSFDADRRIREANQFIRDFRVDSTPTIIVANKYRTDARSAGGYEELVQLVSWLVAKESPAPKPAAAAPAAKRAPKK